MKGTTGFRARFAAKYTTPTPTLTRSVEVAVPKLPYPWTAQYSQKQGRLARLPRIELQNGVFPLTGIPPCDKYSIFPPSSPQKPIWLDRSQLGAVNLILSGATCCITGAAGTGKSTILQAATEVISQTLTHRVSYRIVRSNGQRADAPSFALIAYTNKAKNVIAKNILCSKILEAQGFGPNITTGHNLLEFSRVQEWNEEKECEVMRFREQRTAATPLSITHLAIDEASQLGVGKADAEQLGNKLLDAMRTGVQLVLMGDINQLPPVGGKSILSYGLSQLPIAELTTIHRQALDSPIIAQAWEVLQGRNPKSVSNLEIGSHFKIIHPRGAQPGTKITASSMNKRLESNLPMFYDKGHFVPGRDIILCPFNKEHSDGKKSDKITYVSTGHMNRVLGSHIAQKHGRKVYHIIAGFMQLYMAVGDRVLVDKMEGEIVSIEPNYRYTGKRTKEASTTMNYWGHQVDTQDTSLDEENGYELDLDTEWDYSNLDIDAEIKDDEPTTRASSHIVTVQLDDTEEQVILSGAGQFQSQIFSLGYAISVHKAQGSEWQNVFVVLHDRHATMLSRELLYTAITRPRQICYVIAQEHTLRRCVKNARIRGNSLQSKIAFFNDKSYLDAGEDFSFSKCTSILN